MEVATIDSKDSKFVKDDLYEHINAPQWIDFSATNNPVNDDAWFCRPDCNHPKTVEDFLKQTPNSKLQRSASVSKILPLGDWNRRDAALKKRGLPQPSITFNKDSKCNKYVEDSESQNPNLSTPPNPEAKLIKESIKSSAEKKPIDNSLLKIETPRLKSTLSARNLFAGKDILTQITEFCNELKRMATRVKEREDGEKENDNMSPVAAKKQEGKECSGDKSNVKEKLRTKKRNDEAENKPISVNLKRKSLRCKEEENLLQIRTNPPSPQCFSANCGPAKAAPLPKALRSKPPERGILQELEQSIKEVKEEEPGSRGNQGRNASVVAEKEARTMDVFWFLKPCTLSS